MVQDLVEALKAGGAWAVAGAARTLAGGVGTRWARIAVAPRSRPEHASLGPLEQQLAILVGGIAEPGSSEARAGGRDHDGVARLVFGVLWLRTRWLLIVALHGLNDALSNAPSFMETWGL